MGKKKIDYKKKYENTWKFISCMVILAFGLFMYGTNINVEYTHGEIVGMMIYLFCGFWAMVIFLSIKKK